MENSTATLNFSSGHHGSVSYSLTDGIGSTVSGSAENFSQTLTDQRVTVQGGQTITLTCSPAITVTPNNVGSTGAVSVNPASVSYSVNLVYPTLAFTTGVVPDPLGIEYDAPVGDLITGDVSTRSVFAPINGVITNTEWSVSNSDACNSFAVTSTSGTLDPFEPQLSYSNSTDEWFYFKGTNISGSETGKPIDVSVTITALGESTNDDPSGAITFSSIICGLTTPLQWSSIYTNPNS